MDNSVAACSRETPGFRRAKTASQWLSRSLNLFDKGSADLEASGGLSTGCMESGTHNSRLSPASVPMKFFGATPTTVKPRPFIEICRRSEEHTSELQSRFGIS